MAAWDWDPDSDRTVATESVTDVFGLEAKETLNSSESILRLVHPDDAERQRAIVREAGKRGGNWHTEFRIIRPTDGEVAWLEEWATAKRNQPHSERTFQAANGAFRLHKGSEACRVAWRTN
jgi:PAS domain S-box-containing protein